MSRPCGTGPIERTDYISAKSNLSASARSVLRREPKRLGRELLEQVGIARQVRHRPPGRLEVRGLQHLATSRQCL